MGINWGLLGKGEPVQSPWSQSLASVSDMLDAFTQRRMQQERWQQEQELKKIALDRQAKAQQAQEDYYVNLTKNQAQNQEWAHEDRAMAAKEKEDARLDAATSKAQPLVVKALDENNEAEARAIAKANGMYFKRAAEHKGLKPPVEPKPLLTKLDMVPAPVYSNGDVVGSRMATEFGPAGAAIGNLTSAETQAKMAQEKQKYDQAKQDFDQRNAEYNGTYYIGRDEASASPYNSSQERRAREAKAAQLLAQYDPSNYVTELDRNAALQTQNLLKAGGQGFSGEGKRSFEENVQSFFEKTAQRNKPTSHNTTNVSVKPITPYQKTVLDNAERDDVGKATAQYANNVNWTVKRAKYDEISDLLSKIGSGNKAAERMALGIFAKIGSGPGAVTEDERNYFVNRVNGVQGQAFQKFNDWLAGGDVPDSLVKTFSDAAREVMQKRAAKFLYDDSRGLDRAISSFPNLMDEKKRPQYRAWALAQLGVPEDVISLSEQEAKKKQEGAVKVAKLSGGGTVAPTAPIPVAATPPMPGPGAVRGTGKHGEPGWMLNGAFYPDSEKR